MSNDIVGGPAKGSDYKIHMKGKGNYLFFGESVVLRGVILEVIGDNNVIVINNNCLLKGVIRVAQESKVEIGNDTKFNGKCRIHASEGCDISIGANCLFADVRFRTSDSHSIVNVKDGKRTNFAKNIVVSDGVWIAESVRIYKGVTIGRGSVVGACSVVFSSIPENSLAVGVPAKVIRSNISWSERLF